MLCQYGQTSENRGTGVEGCLYAPVCVPGLQHQQQDTSASCNEGESSCLSLCSPTGSSFVVSEGSYLDVSDWLNPAKLSLYYQINATSPWVRDLCGQRTTDACEQLCDPETGEPWARLGMEGGRRRAARWPACLIPEESWLLNHGQGVLPEGPQLHWRLHCVLPSLGQGESSIKPQNPRSKKDHREHLI